MNPKTSKTEDLVEELLGPANGELPCWRGCVGDCGGQPRTCEDIVRSALTTAENRGYERGLAAAVALVDQYHGLQTWPELRTALQAQVSKE